MLMVKREGIFQAGSYCKDYGKASFRGPTLRLAEHGADADENEISDGDYNR